MLIFLLLNLKKLHAREYDPQEVVMSDVNDKQEKKNARSAQKEIESKSKVLQQSLSDQARDESISGIVVTGSTKVDERMDDAHQRTRNQSQQTPLYPDRFPGAFARRSYHTFSFVHTPAGGIISVATTPEALSSLPAVQKPPSSPTPLELAKDVSNNSSQKTTYDDTNASLIDGDRKVSEKKIREVLRLLNSLFFQVSASKTEYTKAAHILKKMSNK